MFYGLGSDGTVGANKNSIKIIGENTSNYAQGYFVYDSKKAGAVTISHLRFGPAPIRSIYLVTKANFIACHQPIFLDRYDMLKDLVHGGTFLLNSQYGPEQIWDKLPRPVQQSLIDKKAKFYVIDALSVGKDTGMGARINTIMQTCFFALSGVLPREEAIAQIKYTIKKTYGRKGEEVVQKNIAAVDQTLANLFEVKYPAQVTSIRELPTPFTADAPKEIACSLGKIYGNRGEELPVSAFSPDGTFPTGTSRYEKRNLATEIPVWDEKTCIQCAKCVVICPHAAIRLKAYEPAALKGAPATFKSTEAR
jgi:pyruvate-ferredoxin/flavodoxin oxidoreductase